MKTKIIFSALALAMLLATACNKNESAIEESNEKGYALPVTINVTRKGDAPATRATFNDGTKKLSFTPGRFCYPFLGPSPKASASLRPTRVQIAPEQKLLHPYGFSHIYW